MPSTDAATGKYVSAREHYDLLIAEGDDPITDPPVLAEYMNGWDGEALFEELQLTETCRVLEIGVGTGRLALRTLERGCAQFVGLDVSERVLEKTKGHLSGFEGVRLIEGEFPEVLPDGTFDRIYSSLTFMHIERKEAALCAAACLLAPGGRMVLSLDRDRSGVIDMGSRRVTVWPDDPDRICALMQENGLTVCSVRELDRAWLVTAERER